VQEVTRPAEGVAILGVLALFSLLYFPTKKRVYGAIADRLPQDGDTK
jgi:hypothetical protein